MSLPEGSQPHDALSAPAGRATRSVEEDLIEERQTSEKLRQEIRRLQEYIESFKKEISEKTRHLEEAGALAESARQAKSMFLANMSHELRTPLNAILGFSEALVAGIFGELNPKHKEYISEIYKSGMSLLSLINEVLDLSRMESGLTELDCSESSVREIVTSSGYVFKEKAKKHGIEIAVAVAEDAGFFDVDAPKVKQVLVNILSYMFGYTPDGSIIRMQGRQVMDPYILMPEGPGTAGSLTGEFVEISVEDSGPDIGPEERKRLFEPFVYREDLQYRKYDGLSLSLVICRKIAELHHGRLWVEAAPAGPEAKGGNRFIFLLPRHSCENAMRLQ